MYKLQINGITLVEGKICLRIFLDQKMPSSVIILNTLGKILSKTCRACLEFQPAYPRKTISAYIKSMLGLPKKNLFNHPVL